MTTLNTTPMPHWFYEEGKSWAPYTDHESEELEKYYKLTDGKAAYYLEADKVVDFVQRKEDKAKKKEKSDKGDLVL